MRAILVLLVLLLGLSSDVWAGILRQGAAQVLCHRTDNREVPENTLESLALAARVGCNVIEVDIRRTVDGVLVLNHDGYLDRFTTTTGDIETTDLTELDRLDFGAWQSDRFRGIHLAHFDDALHLARQLNVGLYLDIKTKGLGPQILEELAREGMTERVIFGGEWEDIRALRPHANADDAEYVQPGITAARVGELHRAGKPVVANFLSNGHETDLPLMRKAVAAGVDAIWVEYPRLGAEAVGRPVEAKLARLAAQAEVGPVPQRIAAIREFSQFTGYPLQPHLLRWLMDSNDGVSHAAALALVTGRPTVLVGSLEAALRAESPAARKNAAWAIGELNANTSDPQCASLVAPLLDDKEVVVRQAALITLSRCSVDKTVDVQSSKLIALLQDGPPSLQGFASIVLARYYPDIAIREIPAEMRKEESEAAAHDHAWAARGRAPLTQTEIDGVIEHYRAEMKYVQALAALPPHAALTSLASEAFRPAHDYTTVMPLVAGYQLWDRIDADPAAAIAALSSTDEDVADRAMWALVAAGPGVLPGIHTALGASSGEERNRLVEIAAWRADSEALPVLKQLRSKGGDNSELLDWAITKIELMEIRQ